MKFDFERFSWIQSSVEGYYNGNVQRAFVGLFVCLLFNGISNFSGFRKTVVVLFNHSWEDKRIHTFSNGICPESERNSATGVCTRVLRFRSSALNHDTTESNGR